MIFPLDDKARSEGSRSGRERALLAQGRVEKTRVSVARRFAYFRARCSECRLNNGTLLFEPVVAAGQSGAR